MNRNRSLAKELSKHVDVVESTFSRLNLQVVHATFKAYSDDISDADADLLVEIVCIEGESANSNFTIKVNLYDEDGDLYLNEELFVNASDFAGYDTFTIELYDDGHTLLNAKTARIFATKRN